MVCKLDYDDYYSLLNDLGEIPALNAFSFSSVVMNLIGQFENGNFPAKKGKLSGKFPFFFGFYVKLPLPDRKGISEPEVGVVLRSFLSLPSEKRLRILSKIK